MADFHCYVIPIVSHSYNNLLDMIILIKEEMLFNRLLYDYYTIEMMWHWKSMINFMIFANLCWSKGLFGFAILKSAI
jgi:hypothetical protein